MSASRFSTCILIALIFAFSLSAAHAVSITYGPLAWPQDPSGGGLPTSVKLVWWTDNATSTNTAYVGTTPSGPWTFTGTDSVNDTRHEALVTGLSGDTRYYAYVSSNGVNSSVIEFRTGLNLLTNGSLETWHSVSGEDWGSEEPDGWHGWEIYPWQPEGSDHPDHISISMDRNTGLPTPLVKDGAHRVGMDEGWRSCYGGIYQEVTDLPPGTYTVSGWAAWLFSGISYADRHFVEIVVKDGPHAEGEVPTGQVLLSQDGSTSNTKWKYAQGSVQCTSGTLTIYANLRSDDWDGTSFAHFDAFRVMAESTPAVQFSNFQTTRTINGDSYDITISYDTDIPTTTQIQWGPTSSYGNVTPLDSNLVTHHVVYLTGVSPQSTPYHYRALATAPGDIDEYSMDKTFDAPHVVISGVNAQVDSQSGTICMIRWSTNYGTTTNKVYYRQMGSGAYTEVTEADASPHTTHLVSLSGLSLGTVYEFHVSSGGANIITSVSSPDGTFQTPTQPGTGGWYLGMSMVGGDLIDGGDDTGPPNVVQDMIEYDHPLVNCGGASTYSWPLCQPTDPGTGPDVYDWTSGDGKFDGKVPGRDRFAYFQIYGNTPDWLELDTPRYWEKFEAFVEEMVVHINGIHGEIDIVFENEPNISRAPDGWNWADWYMHCLRHFYTAVHRANARTGIDNKVIAGNLSGHAAGGFGDLYARGLKDYSDVLGYHPYPYDIKDGVEVADLARIHGYQVQYGDANKKIWVSEGWGSGRSAGFDRSDPALPMPPEEVENMWIAMTKGWDNVMTPQENWDPSYLYGMKFFCGNDNWGAGGWRERAEPQFDGSGNIIGFIVDGYWMTPDIAPQFWNGGMMDWYGNSKDCLIHVFPGNGLVFMNPGFELASSPPSAHLPHFWTPVATPASTMNYDIDDAIFHGGGNSLKLMRSTAGTSGLYQVTTKRSAIPGVDYRAQVWCKTENVSGTGARFYMRFWSIDGSQKSTQYWAPVQTGTGDWQLLEVTATAPAYTNRIEVGCYLTGYGTAWFDDVVIARADQELTGTVRGYTVDEGHNRVPYAIVRTTTGGHQAVSDANGYYEMQGVTAGTYDFVARKDGYVPFRAKNQTVAPGKLTFASFNLGIPKAGLTVGEVTCDRPSVGVGNGPANVSVLVGNSKQYPVNVSDVGVFVEQNGGDATGKFRILASPSNPKTIPAYGNVQFDFTLEPLAAAEGERFSINAYAFGQEDRPNMLTNGDFDLDSTFTHWGFSGGASTCQWLLETYDVFSSPHALKHVAADANGDKFNWGGNYSAWGPSAPPAKPATKYILGAYHKDQNVVNSSILLFIEEFYYDGDDWFYNGRRFQGLPQRSVWTHDCITYETGDPNVTPGLYAANRLRASVGTWTGQNGTATTWWDDVYLKEEGDWLADDRVSTGADLVVAKPVSSLSDAFDEANGTYVQVSGPILTAGNESFSSRFYAEQEDRALGTLITLSGGSAPAKGARVEITGRVGHLDGERGLLDASLSVLDTPGTPEAVGIVGTSTEPIGLTTRGLLVKVWGRVTCVAPDDSYFVVDDGSGLTDGAGHDGIKVVCSGTVTGISPPAADAFVRVIGISGSEQDGALSVIRPRSQADIE